MSTALSHAIAGTASSPGAGSAGEEIRFAVGESSLGLVLVASSKAGICAILPGDDPAALLAALHERFPRARLTEADDGFRDLVGRVIRYVEKPGAAADFPLDLRGTQFQRKIWRALREIPVGRTASYTDIARRIGVPGGARAVASACAANMLAVAVPCHRVVGKYGALSGYRWGIERKRRLLAQEAQAA